jgi:hypothetical protein
MDASPLLARLVSALVQQRLDVVLIGNAAAAMHGAPDTTLDFDFMFRDTPTNLRKLKAVSASLGAVILRPFYPVSKLYRMVEDASGPGRPAGAREDARGHDCDPAETGLLNRPARFLPCPPEGLQLRPAARHWPRCATRAIANSRS